MVELNCVGTVQLAKLVVRQMRELNAGKILFTASIAGELVAPREPFMLQRKHLFFPSLTAFGMS
jgi:short-subunit dehydrogenase